MKNAAVVCEYNPFHTGHMYQLERAKKELCADNIIGIMSGNYVQRGDIAVYPKQIRAKAAISCGMDLVLELPAVLTLQSAERYAANAVEILNTLGCVDYLFFGAEAPETELLYNIAAVLAHEDAGFKSALRKELDKGISFALARANAVRQLLGDASAAILSSPNNILAVEYCKALIRTNSRIKPYAIARTSVGHDSAVTADGFASATEIRRRLADKEETDEFIPSSAAEIYSGQTPHLIQTMEKALISSLCMTSADTLSYVADVSEGLEYALLHASFEHATLDDVISAVKSKRYAYSRIRRIILNAYLGITKDDLQLHPLYIKILDFNDKGREILNHAKKTATLPLAKNGKQIKNNPKALALWQRELIADRIYEIFQ